MDDLLRIKELLAWNDSGDPPRILRVKSRVADETFPIVPAVCRGCLVAPINPGDEIISVDGGWLRVNCECQS